MKAKRKPATLRRSGGRTISRAHFADVLSTLDDARIYLTDGLSLVEAILENARKQLKRVERWGGR